MQINDLLNQKQIQSLIDCKNSEGDILNIFHEEDNNLEHTQMVLDNVKRFYNQDKDYKILMYAAILHDIAKPVTRIVTEKGWVAFPQHEIKGVKLAYDIIKNIKELSKEDKRKILLCVGYHDIYKYMNNVDLLKEKFSYTDLVLIAKLSLCDNLGRISKVATEVTFQENLINMLEYSGETKIIFDILKD